MVLILSRYWDIIILYTLVEENYTIKCLTLVKMNAFSEITIISKEKVDDTLVFQQYRFIKISIFKIIGL